MKRHGNLFSKIIDIENIRLAEKLAAKGKRNQRQVRKFEENLEEKLVKIQQLLANKNFHTAAYRKKTIYEPKKREISILPYSPDRIVQHALINVLEPIWEGMMIADSYACLKKRGLHAGSKRTMDFVRKHTWCGKCDVSKFYYSIHHDKLIAILERKIKDKNVMYLLKDIIDSTPGNIGLPIGNITSQWFGNIYLNELDTYIKQTLHWKDGYIRYCDDFIFTADSKEEIWKVMLAARKFIETECGMKLSKFTVFPLSHGVDFLGYRHFKGGYILLRKSTSKRVKKKLKAIPYELKHRHMDAQHAESVVASYKGWLRWANTHNLSIATQIIDLEKMVKEAKDHAQIRRLRQEGCVLADKKNIGTDRQGS